MTLSAEDREWVRLVARELSREVITTVMHSHIDSCPHGHTVQKLIAGSKGLLGGLVVASGGLGWVVGWFMRF